RRFTSRSGKELVVLNNVDRIELDGKVFILSTMEDITERKEALHKIYEALRTRDEFLSIASHELKTPLTSLKLQADLRKRKFSKGMMTLDQIPSMIDADVRQLDR